MEANMGVQIKRMMKDLLNPKAEENQEEKRDVQVGHNKDRQKVMENYFRVAGEAFGIDPKNVHTFLAPRTEYGDQIIMKCHENARKVIKETDPAIRVGITMSLLDYKILPGGEKYVEALQDEDFLHYLPYIKDDDYLGVQNYTRKVYGSNEKLENEEDTRLKEASFVYHPDALAGVLRFVSEHWNKPIIVTENGIDTENDEDRIEFIQRALKGVHKCVQEGIQVIGYMHWSLLDTFEWQHGFVSKFGLIAVDRTTRTRYPNKSLTTLGNIKKFGLNERN
jgi:beta-glucosidase